MCSICKSGYLLQNKACVLCSIDNCASCSTDNNCDQCSPGYSLNANSCQFCKSPCLLCAANGCASCLAPFNPTPDANNACFVCNIANCADCAADGQSCTACKSGYDTSSNSTSCVKICPANCDSCDVSASCNRCSKYFYLDANNTCTQC